MIVLLQMIFALSRIKIKFLLFGNWDLNNKNFESKQKTNIFLKCNINLILKYMKTYLTIDM